MTPLLTIKEASGILKIPVGTLYHMVNQKKIPYIKIGKSIRFSQKDIDMWLINYAVKTSIGGW